MSVPINFAITKIISLNIRNSQESSQKRKERQKKITATSTSRSSTYGQKE